MRSSIVVPLAALGALVVLPLAAPAQQPPKDRNRVSLEAARDRITFGATTTLSGKVTGRRSGGVEVALHADPFPVDSEGAVAETTTDANGDFQFLGVNPDRHTRYRVTAKTSPPVTSGHVDVLVRVRVTLRLSDRTPAAGERVRFRGSVTPEHDGVRVRIQRRTRDGRWKTVARTTTRDAGDERSRYSRRVTIRRDGRYRVKVVPHDVDHLAGKSRRRFVDVH
jgi:hypothetical protein